MAMTAPTVVTTLTEPQLFALGAANTSLRGANLQKVGTFEVKLSKQSTSTQGIVTVFYDEVAHKLYECMRETEAIY